MPKNSLNNNLCPKWVHFILEFVAIRLQATLGLGVVAVFRVTSSWDMLLIKDMKMKIYSKAGIYSSVGYVAQYCDIDEDMFVKPP